MATLVRMSIDAVQLADDDNLTYFFILAGSPHLAPLALHLRQRAKQLVVVGTSKDRQSNAFFDLAWHSEILPVSTAGGSKATDDPVVEDAVAGDEREATASDSAESTETQQRSSPALSGPTPLQTDDWWVPFVREQCLQHGARGDWLPLTKLGDLLRYTFPDYDPAAHGRLLQLIKQRLDMFEVHPDTNKTYDFPVTHFVKLRGQRLRQLPEPEPRDRRPPVPRPSVPPGGYKTPRYARQPDYDSGWDDSADRRWIR